MSTAPPAVHPGLAEVTGRINAEISKFEQATLAEANNVADIQPDRLAAFTKSVKEEVAHVEEVMKAELSRATNAIQTTAKSIIGRFEPVPAAGRNPGLGSDSGQASGQLRPDEKDREERLRQDKEREDKPEHKPTPPSHRPDEKPDREHPSQLPHTPKKKEDEDEEEEEGKTKKHGWLGGSKK